ncbi:hypothetical protein [Streptomyces lincolnensis]|uniref:hypothetical protein n=1 Tax=Streptomyces lincolnensis TaxID=1915 RepID=UPI0037D63C70
MTDTQSAVSDRLTDAAPTHQDHQVIPSAPNHAELTAHEADTGQPGHVRHGYTLKDIEHLTRLTLRMDRWYTASDIDERYDAVWFAIVEQLLTAEEPPTRKALLDAGTQASDARVRDQMRTHGRCTLNTGQPMPRFHAYWNPAHAPSPEPRVIERHALAQIWPLLRPSEQRALTALAMTGDYEEGAAAVGVATSTFQVQISTARRRFFKAWHEHETPSRIWRTDRRVRSRNGKDHLGRQRLNQAQVDTYRARYYEGEKLRVLAAECGLSSTALSALIKGKSKAADATR